MLCPTSVKVFPYKGCSKPCIINQKKYSFGSKGFEFGFGSGSYVVTGREMSFTITAYSLAIFEIMRFVETIGNGLEPFAVYLDYGGVSRWYVVRLNTPHLLFDSPFGEWRSSDIKVHILGYARDVTEPTVPDHILCDDGSTMEGSDGCDMWCVPEYGTATDIICS